MPLTRRDALFASTGLLLAHSAPAHAGQAAPKTVDARPLPLPFNPARLPGLSEKLLVSHHENNYAGAWKNLVKTREALAQLPKDAAGPLVAGLRERELTFGNSVVLHELYFGNLGGDGKSAGAVAKALADGIPRFEEQFRALAGSLGGGSGWAILDFCFQTHDLHISWAGHHTQTLAFAAPLLVLDMYEHSYHLDYGAAAARYVDAFFQNVHWDEVNRRYERALKADVLFRA